MVCAVLLGLLCFIDIFFFNLGVVRVSNLKKKKNPTAILSFLINLFQFSFFCFMQMSSILKVMCFFN